MEPRRRRRRGALRAHPGGEQRAQLRAPPRAALTAEGGGARLSAGTLQVGDGSSPEQIRRLFGLSKKAFKRALGTLLKRRVVRIDEAGFVVVLPKH